MITDNQREGHQAIGAITYTLSQLVRDAADALIPGALEFYCDNALAQIASARLHLDALESAVRAARTERRAA